MMKTKDNRHGHEETVGLPSLKLQARQIRQERAHCKAELLSALQEAKEKRKRAITCEKRARASEVRAAKLAQKAELASREAITHKHVAEQARYTAAEVQQLADIKRKLMKSITAKLRLAEQKARQEKKSVIMKQKVVNTSA